MMLCGCSSPEVSGVLVKLVAGKASKNCGCTICMAGLDSFSDVGALWVHTAPASLGFGFLLCDVRCGGGEEAKEGECVCIYVCLLLSVCIGR
jgi:hypothetical protein